MVVQSRPSASTVKRLYAVSRNHCAFPRCTTPLVHEGTLTGEICHIRGQRPGAARFEASQTEDDRHAYDNLIVLCPVHHAVVDADEVAYTVERLAAMKREHESARSPIAEPSDDLAALLSISVDSVVSYAQTGGITAGIVNIVGSERSAAQSRTEHVRIQLDGLLRENPFRNVEVMDGMWEAATPHVIPTRWHPTDPIRIGTRSAETFQLRVPRGSVWCVDIPYALVEAAWTTSEGALGLRLKGRLVLRTGCGVVFESS